MKGRNMREKIDRIKNKSMIVLFIISAIVFAMPSIIYLIKNKTIYKFIYVWTFFFRIPQTTNEKIGNTILFLSIFSILFILYFLIIKNHKKIFQTKKQLFIFIIAVSIIFLIIIPYTSTDVYSYIANRMV